MRPSITFYTNPISDCAARVRLALNLKNLAYKSIVIDLASQQQLEPAYIKINPSGSVPALVIENDNTTPLIVLTQSLAALEYLEEAFPETRRLLPESALERAHVRTFISIIASDTHPLTAPRVARMIRESFDVPPVSETDATSNRSVEQWNVHWIERGLSVYEKTLSSVGTVGLFSVGNVITLADVVLLPELWTAEQFGVDIEQFPRIKSIYGEMMKAEEVRRARQKGNGFESSPAQR